MNYNDIVFSDRELKRIKGVKALFHDYIDGFSEGTQVLRALALVVITR